MKAGWQMKKLAELLQIQNGYAFDSKNFSPAGEMPLIRIRDLKAGVETETKFTGDYDEKYVVKSGDFLIGMDGEFGCYEWKGSPALLNQRVCRLQNFDTALLPRFLFYGVNSHLKEIEDVTGFTTVKHISSRQILDIDFIAPPLPEQQRIVGILDAAFDGIATTKANAEKNLQNARALFESHLQSVFTQRGEGWEEKSLEELGTITSSKRIFKSEYVKSGIPFYRTKEIKQLANSREITTELFISEARYNEIKSGFGVPKEGDILLTAIGTIGEIWVVEGKNNFYFKDGNVLWLKEFASINPHFLKYVLLSFVESLNKMSHGAAYSALPIQRLNAHKIFLPSPAEQEQIVATLNALREETQRLASLYQLKLAALEELKKSLLHQAFSGAL